MSNDPIESQALVSGALVECQGQLKAAEFDATNPFFKSKYATLGSVIAASREALSKNGLAILQKPTIQGDQVSVQTTIIHKSGQTLDGGTMSLPLEGNDRNSDAQIAGSILTYLKRYAWASVLGIYADLDDDGNSGPKGAIPRQKPLQASGSPSDTTQANKIVLGASGERTGATPAARMRALNLLQAAPGQINRNMFSDFLRSREWIKGEQQPEDWPLEHVPKSKEEMGSLSDEVQKFHMRGAQQELQEELPQ